MVSRPAGHRRDDACTLAARASEATG